jgi:hypothetical protein
MRYEHTYKIDISHYLELDFGTTDPQEIVEGIKDELSTHVIWKDVSEEIENWCDDAECQAVGLDDCSWRSDVCKDSETATVIVEWQSQPLEEESEWDDDSEEDR